MERDIIVGKIYRHISGNYYRVICIANDSTKNIDGKPQQLVVYESLNNDRKVWVRPYYLFTLLRRHCSVSTPLRTELLSPRRGRLAVA